MTPAILALLLGPVVPGSITTPEAIEQCIRETQPVPACAVLPAGRAEACEICTLRYRERDLTRDVARLAKGRSEADTEARALEARMHEIEAEMQAAEQGARTRATWALGLGAVGAGALAAGLLLGEPWAIGGGTLAVAAGITLARW